MRKKLDALPKQNREQMLQRNGKVRIYNLPKFDVIYTMSHTMLIILLRHCPYSENFGCQHEELNINNMTNNLARQKVLNLILANRNSLKKVDERSIQSEASLYPCEG